MKIANGGLDANWLVRHKVPTVTFGAGQNAIHTVDEFVDLSEFAAGCRLAVALAGPRRGIRATPKTAVHGQANGSRYRGYDPLRRSFRAVGGCDRVKRI